MHGGIRHQPAKMADGMTHRSGGSKADPIPASFLSTLGRFLNCFVPPDHVIAMHIFFADCVRRRMFRLIVFFFTNVDLVS